MRVKLLDHVAIATPNLDEGSIPYTMLGMVPEGPDEVIVAQDVKVRTFALGETLIELLAPIAARSPITSFLAKRGPGLHHIAYRVDKLDEEVARLRLRGARLLSDTPVLGRANTRVIFLHPKWGMGTLIELVEHSQHILKAKHR